MKYFVIAVLLIAILVAGILLYLHYRKAEKKLYQVLTIVLTIFMAIIALAAFLHQIDKAPDPIPPTLSSSSLSAESKESTSSEPNYYIENEFANYTDEMFNDFRKEKRQELENAVYNRFYDRALDTIKQLAEATKKMYGEKSIELGVVYAEIGEIYNFLSDYPNAQKYVDLAQVIADSYTPTDENYRDLAKIYKGCGDANSDYNQSGFYYNKSIDLLQSYNDTSDDLIANIYTNFADTCYQFNDHVNALSYADKARKLYESTLGTTSRDAGITYCLLGNIYSERNRIEALDYYEKAERIFKNNAPKDDAFLAVCYSGMAGLYSDIDQIQCYDYSRKAVELNKTIYGANHINTIKSETDLATYYRTNGDNKQALLLLEEALLKSKEKYGENSDATVQIYIEIGSTKENPLEAISFYEQALTTLKRMYGENHTKVAFVYANMAVSYYENDNIVKAKDYCERAMKIFSGKTGSVTVEMARLYTFMGDIYYYKEDDEISAAIDNYVKARSIYETLYGYANVNTALCNLDLARLYNFIGDEEKAGGLFKDVLTIYRQAYGDTSLQMADVKHEYSRYLYKYGNRDEAMKECQNAIDIMEAHNQPNSIDTAKYYFTLGNIYAESMESSELQKAIICLESSIRIHEFKNVVNAVYIDSLSSLSQIYAFKETNRNKALECIEKAVKAAEGYSKPHDLCAVYFHTAVAFGNLREYDRALQHLDKAESIGKNLYDASEQRMQAINDYRSMIIKNRDEK